MHKIVKRKKKDIKKYKNLILLAILILSLLLNIDTRDAQEKASDYEELIYSSEYLSDEEKELLANDKLFLDIADTNNSRLNNIIFKIRLRNLQIVDYNEEDLNAEVLANSDGYYQAIKPNVLHIRSYSNKDLENISDVLTHEFSHLLQLNKNYAYLKETAAEIVSNEYYGSPISSYKKEILRVKVLMELIGSDCVWQYLEGKGSLALIINLLDYLSFSETYDFLGLLSVAPNNTEKDYNKEELNTRIDAYLAKIYFNKYGKDISEDLLISAIYDGENVNRLYFNTDRRTSYEYSTFALTLEEAKQRGYKIDEDGENYKIIAILDEYVIIEEHQKQLQLKK